MSHHNSLVCNNFQHASVVLACVKLHSSGIVCTRTIIFFSLRNLAVVIIICYEVAT